MVTTITIKFNQQDNEAGLPKKLEAFAREHGIANPQGKVSHGLAAKRLIQTALEDSNKEVPDLVELRQLQKTLRKTQSVNQKLLVQIRREVLSVAYAILTHAGQLSREEAMEWIETFPTTEKVINVKNHKAKEG